MPESINNETELTKVIGQVTQGLEDGELSEDELEAVAGGVMKHMHPAFPPGHHPTPSPHHLDPVHHGLPGQHGPHAIVKPHHP